MIVDKAFQEGKENAEYPNQKSFYSPSNFLNFSPSDFCPLTSGIYPLSTDL